MLDSNSLILFCLNVVPKEIKQYAFLNEFDSNSARAVFVNLFAGIRGRYLSFFCLPITVSNVFSICNQSRG